MMLSMYILVALGLGLVLYAIVEVFTSGKSQAHQKQKNQDQPLPAEDSGKEQKIQRLQSQIAKLESQLEQAKVISVEGKSGSTVAKEKEAEFSVELKRREEWVAKAEAELTKIKAENSDLNNKFIAKEKELEEEFTKNVNLTREMREIKSALEAKEMACRLKEDQLQLQKHQIESQLKSMNEHLATIAEFNRKEKISEWVPKQEFNQLNAEYTKLEKDLEVSQERLKSFAAEIAHLRQGMDKKYSSTEEIKLPEVISEETKQERSTPEEIKPQGNGLASTSQSHKPQGNGLASTSQSHKPQGNGLASASQSHKPQGNGLASASQSHKPQEAAPEEAKPEETKLEETKAAEEIKIVDESIEKKTKETEGQQQKKGNKDCEN